MYNHATFCDLVITGLVGLRPRSDEILELNPLIDTSIAYFALEGVTYHGRSLSIVWDQDGSRYGRGKGLSIWVDNERFVSGERLAPLQKPLSTIRSQQKRTLGAEGSIS